MYCAADIVVASYRCRHSAMCTTRAASCMCATMVGTQAHTVLNACIWCHYHLHQIRGRGHGSTAACHSLWVRPTGVRDANGLAGHSLRCALRTAVPKKYNSACLLSRSAGRCGRGRCLFDVAWIGAASTNGSRALRQYLH